MLTVSTMSSSSLHPLTRPWPSTAIRLVGLCSLIGATLQPRAAHHTEVAKSGRALFAPQPTHWGTLWFVARDPDGNLIAFEQIKA